MFFLRIILFPFSLLFDLVTRIRNYLYDIGHTPSASFDIPIISVGNLTVGGTGKTPMVEYLYRTLSPRKIALLSRGYGRKTKGIRIANQKDTAATIGDEPFQFYQKFPEAVVAVAEDRVFAVPEIIAARSETTLIILDDAFQHRRIKPLFSILLTDFSRPFYKDTLLPAGRLRESKTGVKRADVVVVTKCPREIDEEAMMSITNEVQTYTAKPVFFATIRYGVPISFGQHSFSMQDRVILVTGIANASPLKKYLHSNYTLIGHIEFGDHHKYSEKDLKRITAQTSEGVAILTTEKDMVKLNAPEFIRFTSSLPFFYVPIQTEFVKNGEEFDTLVKTAIENGV